MSVNIISLNQIIDLFKDFADRHYFINDFGYGATSDIGTSRQMEFPYMWVTTTQDSVINPQNKTAIPDLSFVVLFMDKTNIQENYLQTNGVNSNNVQEVLSDMLQVLQDFVTEVQVNFNNYGLSFVDVVRCYPGIDETQDSVNGWIGEFTLRVKHSNCILPTGDIVQTNLSPINPTTRYLTCDTVTACTSLQQYVQSQVGGGVSQYQIVDTFVENEYHTITHNLNNQHPVFMVYTYNWYSPNQWDNRAFGYNVTNYTNNSFDIIFDFPYDEVAITVIG